MEIETKKQPLFGMSKSMAITLKAIIILILSLVMLIPGFLIQGLIREREMRSEETIEKINNKWSYAQTLYGPLLVVPYTKTVPGEGKLKYEEHQLCITPERLSINAELFPEERHYGIYKTTVYESAIMATGHFPGFNYEKALGSYDIVIHWEKAYITFSVSDLRGLTSEMSIKFGNKEYSASPDRASEPDPEESELLSFLIDDKEVLQSGGELAFSYNFNLRGSRSIDFIPIAKNTEVNVKGDWQSPSYTGSFSPEIKSCQSGFEAEWNVLSLNRNIPDYWIDNRTAHQYTATFGVYLLDPVNIYQQSMRSAKYALLFIFLTFIIFFFVELLSKKSIHPVQYFMVGIALLLFYTLLLSLSEHLHFGWSYLIASVATIGLITIYSLSVFRNKKQTFVLSLTLSALYIFLYVVLQLEDIALLIGSIGLFVILAVLMYVSGKINWYKQE